MISYFYVCFLIAFANSVEDGKWVGFSNKFKLENKNWTKVATSGQVPNWLRGHLIRNMCSPNAGFDDGRSNFSLGQHFFECESLVGTYKFCNNERVSYSSRREVKQASPFTKTELKTKISSIFDTSKAHNTTKRQIQTSDDIIIDAPLASFTDSNGDSWGTSLLFHNNYDNTWDTFRLIYYGRQNTSNTKKIVSSFHLNTIKLNSCKTNSHGIVIYDQPYFQNLMGYVQTMAVTDNYIVLPISNYVIHPCYMLHKSNSSLFDDWYFVDQRRSPLTFQIYRKSDGKLFRSISGPDSADFISHIFNAYEVQNHFYLESLTFPDERLLTQYFRLSFLLFSPWPSDAYLVRYFVNTTSNEYTRLQLSVNPLPVYFPSINPNFYGKSDQKFVYLIRNPFTINNDVLKFNIKQYKDTNLKSWQPSSGVFINNVVFIPSPNSTVEDDGILLVVGFNSTSHKGVVFLLTALRMSLEPIATIEAPYLTPFGVRSHFVELHDQSESTTCNYANFHTISSSLSSFCFLMLMFMY